MAYQFGSFKGVFAIVLASLLWGTTGAASSFSVDVSPLAIGAFSMGNAGVLLVFTARKQLFIDSQSLFYQLKFVLLGAISIAIYPLAFYSSMSLSGVAIGTVVSIATAPFFTALLERIVSKKHISAQWIVSFVIGMIGIVFLVLGKEQNSEVIINAFWQNLGVALGVLAGLSYALYSWVARDLIEKGIHSQSAMSAMFGCAALLLLPSLWFTGGNLFSNFTNTFVSLYMAIIPMYLGYVLFAFGLKWVDASKATLITLIEPLVAAILAVLVIGESFIPVGWFGMALVFLCLLIQTWPFKTRV
ncbi:EamA family transporter [Alteromonas sp. 5E99-2]|uniref:EamA family transporter n=1 Tax=Alteromonas sp. 5E99-2 TaxID=2817683 RepID=UPI001A98A74D|nr:EamA family transporter [Alteromonas sp. 5E99-2]